MGKRYWTGDQQPGHRHGVKLRCKGCRCPIVYGDRCPDCQQRLRQRRRRKPR